MNRIYLIYTWTWLLNDAWEKSHSQGDCFHYELIVASNEPTLPNKSAVIGMPAFSHINNKAFCKILVNYVKNKPPPANALF